MKQLNVKSWNRREHFEFFRNHAFPYLSTTVKIPCRRLVDSATKNGESLFARYLHAASVAANATPALRLRIKGDGVIEEDVLHIGSTIGRPDGTFAFSFTPHKNDFKSFFALFDVERTEVLNSSGLRLHTDGNRTDLIHYTSLPWFNFEHISHPVRGHVDESVPKIAFGKITSEGSRIFLPVNIHVHHALVDGIDIAHFYQKLEDLIA